MEWRQVSPYLLPFPQDPAPARFLPSPSGERTRLSDCLPPQRWMWRMSMSFRKAVAQTYCFHKHIVNEYHYEKHFWGAFEKKEGLLCFSPLHTLRSRCLHALDMWRKPWFSSQGPVLGAPCRRVTLATDASLTGWGVVMRGHPAQRSVERSPSHMAHQLLGEAGRVLSTETLSPGPKRSSCVGAHRQHNGGLLYKPPGRSAFVLLLQAGAPDPCVVPGQNPLPESSANSWSSQYGSRHSVVAVAKSF